MCFSLVGQTTTPITKQAPVALLREWALQPAAFLVWLCWHELLQILWAELRCLYLFMFSLLKQVAAFVGSVHCCQQFFRHCFAGASLCRISGWSQGACVFPDWQGEGSSGSLIRMGAVLWAVLRVLCFPCSRRLLFLQDVGVATSSFSGAALLIRDCRFSGWSQSTCVFPDFLGDEHCHLQQLFLRRWGSTSRGPLLARTRNFCYLPRPLLHLLQELCSPKGEAAS